MKHLQIALQCFIALDHNVLILVIIILLGKKDNMLLYLCNSVYKVVLSLKKNNSYKPFFNNLVGYKHYAEVRVNGWSSFIMCILLITVAVTNLKEMYNSCKCLIDLNCSRSLHRFCITMSEIGGKMPFCHFFFLNKIVYSSLCSILRPGMFHPCNL